MIYNWTTHSLTFKLAFLSEILKEIFYYKNCLSQLHSAHSTRVKFIKTNHNYNQKNMIEKK